MTKITLNNVGSLIDATTAANTINTNNAVIQIAFDNTLSRDGTTPNTMGSELDMNSHQVLNLPAPAGAASPLRLQDLSTFVGGGTVTNIPIGGTTGQVFTKNSNTNYDAGWRNTVSSVGLALPADFTVTNSPVTTTGTLTGAWATTPTGTGAVVRATSPTLVTPALGTPSAAVLTSATGLPVSTGISGLGTGVATFLGTPSSANLATAVTDETGTGALVFAGSPALTGTPTAPTAAAGTNTTQLATTAGIVAERAATKTLTNTTYDTAGAGNSFSINGVAATANTGTGSVVRATSPALVTPVLGAATATTINGVTIDNLAWTAYSPTVTASGGTPTTVTATGRYKQIGKTIFVQTKVTITTVGTATGNVNISLPFAAVAFDFAGSTFETGVTAKSGACTVAPSASVMNTRDATGTSWWVNGYILICTMTYETP